MYKTVSDTGSFQQVINKSTFIASCFHVESEEEISEILLKEKKKYPDARHCCWAYVLGEKMDVLRYSDDGEPQGTAGQPILQVLVKKNITNVLVTVTRYFGGILLGAGGLTRAYSSSASGAVDECGIRTMMMSSRMLAELEYATHSRLEKAIAKSDYIRVENIEYAEKVRLFLSVKAEDEEKLTLFLTEATGGKEIPVCLERLFMPWED